MVEAGGTNIDTGTWHALRAPANTSVPILARLRAKVREALATPETQRAWQQRGAGRSAIPDVQLDAYVCPETARWCALVTYLGRQTE